ncbi:hypothetical protein WMF40_45145 [Sorangium sp. So ce854]
MQAMLQMKKIDIARLEEAASSKFEPKSAALAWQRTVEFLHTHMG